MKTIKSFTMAEVLITLGIVGIVAAMTLPSLVGNHRRKVLESQFKRSYSQAAQALEATKFELGLTDLNAAFTHYDEENKEYINADLYTDTFYKQVNIKNKVDSKKYADQIRNYTLDRTFTSNNITCTPVYMLKDGSSICTKIWSRRISITVDINGPQNKPNAFGHDIFMFLVNNQDVLQGQKPSEGAPDPNNEYYETNKNPCSIKYNTAGNGIGCSYYALMNECPDGKGKSYWECLPK